LVTNKKNVKHVYLRGCGRQDGLYTSLNESDEQAIRRKIGVYYNFFTKPTTDDVVFSVPYIGSQGLGMKPYISPRNGSPDIENRYFTIEMLVTYN